ncbi:hypothetical protein CIPAW_01G243200 [Carya illinoinensis]|uniref:Uncharacterized protein n=1 Tax=Carya illinoinensis TaxID=32201 RepID=A0A8T1RS45_CARIL|nr:hypothetical protein CIPAW_01G243200 [Carya illinoinensis]
MVIHGFVEEFEGRVPEASHGERERDFEVKNSEGHCCQKFDCSLFSPLSLSLSLSLFFVFVASFWLLK